MGQVKITLPPGVSADPSLLTSAVRFALQGTDPGKIWRQNSVPAIAQLEEGAYTAGMHDLAEFYDAVVTGLNLPVDRTATVALNKALQPDALNEEEERAVYEDLRKIFGFKEATDPPA